MLATAISRPPALALGPTFEQLPRDERQAARMLADGSLDSSLWESVKGLYDEPLSVPGGELAYLTDAFPSLRHDLPVTAKRLARYEPWCDTMVQRFFEDYPELLVFRPILCFAGARVPHIGTIGFRSTTRSVQSVPRQSVHFNLDGAGIAGLDGTVAFESTHARWQRRNIRLTVPSFGDIQLGNFSLRFGDGLFLGSFGAREDDGSDTRANWLYGDAATWNGAAVKGGIGERTDICLFVHHRPSESALGAVAAVELARYLRLSMGVAGLEASGDFEGRDTLVLLLPALKFKKGNWAAEVTAGLQPSTRSAPLSASVRFSDAGARFDARVTALPRDYRAPRSGLVKQVHRLLELSDSTMETTALVEAGYREKFSEYLGHSYRLQYIAGETESVLRTVVGLEGEAPLSYGVTYYYQPSHGSAQTRHKVHGRCGKALGEKLALNGSISYYTRAGEYNRTWIAVEPEWQPTPLISFTPRAEYSINSLGAEDMELGFIHRMQLFEKTFADIAVTVPVLSVRDEGVVVNARSGFYF